ncbi:MAG: hypothetical protein ACOC22_01260, partial [bacterium]
LMTGQDFGELLERVPDEFFDWLKKTKSDLERQFKDIEHEILKEFYQIYFKEDLSERKAFAEKALQSRIVDFYLRCMMEKIIMKRFGRKSDQHILVHFVMVMMIISIYIKSLFYEY